MAKLEENKIGVLAYAVHVDGEEVAHVDADDPVEYFHGGGNIVPGLENALEGKEPGDEFDITVPPEEGYGPRDERMIQEVPRNMFEGVDKIEPGMQFQAQTEAGPRIITVQEVGQEEVKIDGNHPLAGETVTYDIDLVSVVD